MRSVIRCGRRDATIRSSEISGGFVHTTRWGPTFAHVLASCGNQPERPQAVRNFPRVSASGRKVLHIILGSLWATNEHPGKDIDILMVRVESL